MRIINKNIISFYYLLFLCIFCLYLFSCNSSQSACERGFYVWKTILDIDSVMSSNLQSLNVKRLYVRYFDVEKGKSGPEPIAPIRLNFADSLDFEWVPVVYITQPAMQSIAYNDSFAHRIYSTLCAMHGGKPAEVQLDCDWTERTREPYFNLVRQLKRHDIVVSTTLRLHQIKYVESAGVPPADRATLMCYHTSNPEKYEDKNAVLDLDEVKKYISRDVDYPIPIDVALPVFSWGVKFKNRRFAGIISGLTRTDVEKSNFFDKTGKHVYIAEKSGYLKGVHFQKGDELRVDEPDVKQISDAAKWLSRRIKNKSGRVLLFDLSLGNLYRIGVENYEKIFRSCEP